MAGDVGKGFKPVVIVAMILGQEKAKGTFQVWSIYISMITGAAIGINREFHKRRAQFYQKSGSQEEWRRRDILEAR